MKKIYLPLFFALGLSSSMLLAAQTPVQPQEQTSNTHPQIDPDKQAQHLAKKLNLVSDQESQLRPILADRAQQMQAIRSDTSLNPKDRGAKMRSLRAETDTKIKALLTDDQKQKYDQWQQERMQQHRQHQAGQNTPQS